MEKIKTIKNQSGKDGAEDNNNGLGLQWQAAMKELH